MTFQWTTNQDRNRHESPTTVYLIWEILRVAGRRQTLMAKNTVKMLNSRRGNAVVRLDREIQITLDIDI